MQQISDRISALRGWLELNKLAALVVPIADEFQTEYPFDHSKRLEWICGFKGSMGLAVIGLDQADFYRPGLYELQAKAQVDPVYNLKMMTRLGMCFDDEFCESLPDNSLIACDARLITPSEANRFAEIAEKHGHQMEWLLFSPIDDLWEDQPAANTRPLFAWPDAIAGQSSSSKRTQLGATLGDADCTILNLGDSLSWLLNVRGYDAPTSPFTLSYGILHHNGEFDWFVEGGKLTDEVRAHVGDVRIHELDTFWDALPALKGRHVIIEDQSAPFAVRLTLENSGATVISGVDPCQAPKAEKHPSELTGIRAAHIRDGAYLSQYLCWLEQQLANDLEVTELSAADQLTRFRATDPLFHSVSFPPISAVGENAALPHYHAEPDSNAQVRSTECYLVDSGGQYLDGGTTDVTRSIWLEQPSAAYCDAYTRVLKGYIAIDQQRFPTGTTGAQLDPFARQFLWQVGKDYGHGTGHGVGAFLNVHEGPQRISPAGSVALAAGNVLSNEPGYYLENHFGIRIENLVEIIELEDGLLGISPLTLCPIDTRPIERNMLTDREASYLNDYHARVLAETGPLVDPATLEWLKQRCAAI
jgi:Xaa-Pro aminopeptidase